MHEESLETSTVWYMRRTGPYGPENAALMTAFQDWLLVRRLFREDTVILGIPLDDPRAT